MNPLQSYKLSKVASSSPVGLVVLLYDAVLESFHRALRAMMEQDVEKRTNELSHAIGVIGQLERTLDHERAPDVTRSLQQFYNVIRTQIVLANSMASADTIRRLIEDVTTVREAWVEVDRQQVPPPSAPAVAQTTSQPSSPKRSETVYQLSPGTRQERWCA